MIDKIDRFVQFEQIPLPQSIRVVEIVQVGQNCRMSEVFPSNTDATSTQWKGLPSKDLRKLEILFCAPINRELRYSGHAYPTARCGRMIGEVYRYVKSINSALPPQRYFGDDDFISRLFAGEYSRKKPTPRTWAELRRLFERILRGDRLEREAPNSIPNIPGADVDEQRIRDRIITRMADYFFIPDDGGFAQYFAPAVLDISAPQSPSEACYQLLWMAADVLRPGASAGLVLASGGPPFPFFETDGALNEIGRAAMTATACGVVLSFAVPSPTICQTSAFTTAKQFLIEAGRRQGSGQFPEWFAALATDKTDAQLNRHREMMSDNIRLYALDPTLRKNSAWAGQFLNPAMRFTRTYHSADTRSIDQVVVVPSAGSRPFAVSLSDRGQSAFRAWENVFLTKDTLFRLKELQTKESPRRVHGEHKGTRAPKSRKRQR